jgi:hypothetical protein
VTMQIGLPLALRGINGTIDTRGKPGGLNPGRATVRSVMPSGGAANLRRQVKGAMSGTKKVEGGAKTPATSYAVGRSGAVKGCRVPGCTVADLSGASRYCLRHRICEEHLKSLSVNFDSKPHRFCQKCSACPISLPPLPPHPDD